MSNVVQLRPAAPPVPHRNATRITAKLIASAEKSAREKYPERSDLQLASLVGKYEGALIMVLHAIPGAAEFLARVEGIEVE